MSGAHAAKYAPAPMRGSNGPPYVMLVADAAASRAEGPEARMVSEIFESLAKAMRTTETLTGALLSRLEEMELGPYNHIAPKHVFTATVTYKHVGRLKPRQFPIDE